MYAFECSRVQPVNLHGDIDVTITRKIVISFFFKYWRLFFLVALVERTKVDVCLSVCLKKADTSLSAIRTIIPSLFEIHHRKQRI